MRRAPAPYSPVQIVAGGRGDEIIVVPREELQSPRLRRERPERDGKVHQLVGLVADGDYPGIGVRYPAGLVLVLGHVVDDVLFHLVVFCTGRIHRTNQIYLVVLEF